jgi:hypothetical protein
MVGFVHNCWDLYAAPIESDVVMGLVYLARRNEGYDVLFGPLSLSVMRFIHSWGTSWCDGWNVGLDSGVP